MFNRNPQRSALATGALALVVSLAAGAQGMSPTGAESMGEHDAKTGQMPAAGGAMLSHGDRSFVQKAAMSGRAEVELARLAPSHAASDQVKQFAAHMVDDHGKANDKLAQLASSKGVELASDDPGKKDADKLGKLNGADFDRAFMKQMVADHKKAVAAFQKASQSAKDPDIKAFATQTLPALQSHLQMAQGINVVAGPAAGTQTDTTMH